RARRRVEPTAASTEPKARLRRSPAVDSAFRALSPRETGRRPSPSRKDPQRAVTVAIVADIHGNLEALTTVLDHVATKGITRIVCLGDIIGYGPNPRECLKLRFRSEIAIMGNQEEAGMFYGEDVNPRSKEASELTKDQ